LAGVKAPAGGFEILIAGEGASSEPGHLPESVRYIPQAGSRVAALNAACDAAQGQIWVFADDDCEFPQDWLVRIEQALRANPDADILGGRDALPSDASLFDHALDLTLNSLAGTGGIRTAATVSAGRYYPKLWNMVVRSDAARRAAIDGAIFNPSLDVHEDVELSERIARNGGKILHIPEIMVWHHRDTDFMSFFFRNIRMAKVCREQGIHRTVHVAAAAFFATMALAGMTAPRSQGAGRMLFLLAGSYGLLLSVTGVVSAWKAKSPAMLIMVPILTLSLHLARAIGYVLGPTRGERQ